MKYLKIAVCLLWGAAAFSQEPTLEEPQCQADQKLWRAESENTTEGTTSYRLSLRDRLASSSASLSVDELLQRAKEMQRCIPIDPRRMDDYDSTAVVILSQATKKLVRYLHETEQVERYSTWEKRQQTMHR